MRKSAAAARSDRQPEEQECSARGQIQLRVIDLDQAVEFYRDLLGFTLYTCGPAIGLPAAFLAGPALLSGYIGAYQFEIAYPDLAGLAAAVRRLAAYDYPIQSEQNGRGTLSVYLKDPEGNGIELYHDQLGAEWLGAPVVQAVRVGPLGDEQSAE